MQLIQLCMREGENMNDVFYGVKEYELSNLTLEVLDYADRTSQILENIDAKMDELATHYQGDSYKELMNYYAELQSSYSTIKNNIISYSDDLAALLIKMKENDKTVASLFDEATVDINQKIKSIEG